MVEKDNFIVLDLELYSSKNSKNFVRLKNGRTLLLKSPQAQEQDKVLLGKKKDGLLYQNSSKWSKMVSNLDFPYKLGIFIYRKTKRRFDYINIVQGLFDAMQEAGWIEDDDANHLIPVFLGYDVDKENPRVVLTIIK